MTLIVYSPCRDGSILISDRQSSEPGGYSRPEKKTFSSESKNFFVACAGDSIGASRIFSSLCQATSFDEASIRQKLSEIVEDYRSGYSSPSVDVRAICLARNENNIIPYEITIISGQIYVDRISVDFRSCGLHAAQIIADYLLSKKKIDELDWKTATQYLIAVMNEVANEVDGVGKIEEFGIDISILLDNGGFHEKQNLKENTAKFATELDMLKDIAKIFETLSEGENSE